MARNFKILTFEDAGDGLTQTYKVPLNTRSVNLQADGNVYEHPSTGKGDDYWPLGAGQKEAILATDEAGSTLYFTGDEGAKLYIRTITGLGC